jgi:hypothetical protein
MADVTKKIIDGNTQPKEGYAVLQAQPAAPDSYFSLTPPVNKGKTVAEFDSLYTNRFDRPRYYTSTPSGLPY